MNAMGAGAWAQETFGNCDLGDERRTKRLVALVEGCASHIGASTVVSCHGDEAKVEAAYRFIRNDKIKASAILEAGFSATRKKALEIEGLLAIEDTTSLSYLHQAPEQLTCKRLLKVKSALWTFVLEGGVEPTNNLAERTIRPLVIWCKKSFGTQSPGGSHCLERIMTVASSCRLQGRNVLDFVEKSVQAYFNQQKPPSLLPGIELASAINIAA